MFSIDEDQSKRNDKKLEIIAEIPTPAETVMHVTPHREEVFDEQDVSPHVLTIGGSINEVGPEGAGTCESHYLPIDDYGNQIGRDDSAKTMENRKGKGQRFLQMSKKKLYFLLKFNNYFLVAGSRRTKAKKKPLNQKNTSTA